MQFYSVNYCDPNLGQRREHFSSEVKARKAIREEIVSDTEIELNKHDMPSDKATILEALNAAANVAGDGPTGYPGQTETVRTFKASKAGKSETEGGFGV